MSQDSDKETSQDTNQEQHILYEVEDRVARITVNRPRYRNSQSTPLIFQLDDAIMRAGNDRDVRVIVLAGAGEHWSAGHDLGTPEQIAYKEKNVEDGIRGFFNLTYGSFVETHLRWRNVQKPMICAVQGYCIFGGWMVASTADIIFASDDALFLGSLFQYFSIPYDIPPRRAKEILFQGRFINADEAKELGLVNRVIPRERLMEETMAYARDVAQNDPFDLRMTKIAINQALDAQGFTAHIHNAHSSYIARYVGEKDPGFAVKAPAGKRKPMVQVALERYQREQARNKG
jgi:enoyl-CoA hydratase